jgi:peptidoglycan glycosyltransferase
MTPTRCARRRATNAERPTPGQTAGQPRPQFGYAPGSTFKIVTATAAIDTRRLHAESTLSGRNDMLDLRRAAGNDDNESFGDDHAHPGARQIGQHRVGAGGRTLGKRTMARYMDRFGFDRKPELDYPAEEMSASGEYLGESGAVADEPAGRRRADGHRPGQARGDPLQMAEVAAAVANHGKLMVPHLTERIVDPKGAPCSRSPRACSRS